MYLGSESSLIARLMMDGQDLRLLLFPIPLIHRLSVHTSNASMHGDKNDS